MQICACQTTEQYLRLHPDDIMLLANAIVSAMQKTSEQQDELLTLKQLSEHLGIPYSTLSKKALPYCRVGRHGKKMYRVSDVTTHLKR